LRHLQLPALKADGILAAVNQRRTLLGLSEIAELTSDTKLDDGLTAAAGGEQFNKQAALRDLNAAAEALAGLGTEPAAEASAIVADIEKLEKDPALLIAVQQRSFVEKGLDLVDGPDCPLCDQEWESEAALRAHLEEKLNRSKKAQDMEFVMLANGASVAQAAARLAGIVGALQRLAAGQAEKACADRFANWKAQLDTLRAGLGTLDGIIGFKDRLTAGWPDVPPSANKDLADLTGKVGAKPDQTATVDAQTFLTTAQLRLGDYREAMRKNEAAKIAAAASKTPMTPTAA
jgi:hypothetical protein